jgi:hypothetical protein
MKEHNKIKQNRTMNTKKEQKWEKREEREKKGC